MVKLFIDSANLEEIREAISWGVVEGCTTNPKILSKEKNVDFESRMREIVNLVNGPVFIQVTSTDLDEIVSQAKKYASWGDNVVVKIPLDPLGFKATTLLKQESDIRICLTSGVTVNQAILAAKSGADYISLLIGRIEDLGYDGTQTIREAVDIFQKENLNCQILIGSIRTMGHVVQSLKTGAHSLTITYPILKMMAENTKTKETIQEFLHAWKLYQEQKRL